MIVNVWLVLDPKGDRPYVQTHPPTTLARQPGMRVLHYELNVPEPVPAEGPYQAVAVSS
jgi:hypothetical protein